MTNITRFDPFLTGMDPYDERFKEFFRRMWKPARWTLEGVPGDIKIDVEESDKAYTVKAEIPGVKKDDISVRIDANVVSVTAESKREKEVKEEGRVIRSERYYGALARTFSLAHDVDEAAAAKYADGILELTLPKKATPAAKKLAVQ